jgi:glycerophosphoryl diester phosphodiesterase
MKQLVLMLSLALPVALHAAEPWIIAHRGASHDAPENTLPAFELAWKQGADGIEGDFHLTADKKVICIHDYDTQRVSGKKLIVAKSNLSELQKLDVGTWKDPQWRDVRMPTLDEVLATVPKGRKFYIEIKSNEEIVPYVLASVVQSKVPREQIIIISFDQKVIASMRKSAPDLVANWLTGFENKTALTPSAEEASSTLTRIEASGIGIKADPRVDEAFVQHIKQQDRGFHVWTIDDLATAKRFRSLGVNSITTNRPAWLREGLEK